MSWRGVALELQPYQLHRRGSGRLPQGFDLLGIPRTDLDEQPAAPVGRLRLWHEQKAKAEEQGQKQEQRKARRR
jgi:hypothetical protein